MAINVVSLNVRGIKDPIKRRTIFNYYRSRANVLCLQETHSQVEDEKIWAAEYGGDILFSHGQSNSKGVCIVLDKALPYKVVTVSKDTDGRIICCELESKDDPTKRISLCNIYGPNKDCPQFFVNAYKIASELSSEMILIGDYNLVMNTSLDRKGSQQNWYKSRETIEQMCEEAMLTEIWRDRNPTETLFSWMRVKPLLSASRIDFALVSQGTANAVLNTMYLPGIRTDHMAFYVSIDLIGLERGRGYWKFNSSMLQNVEFLQKMNVLLDKTLEDTKHLLPIKRWTYIKKEAIQFAKTYTKNQVKERDLIISQLSEKILELEFKVSQQYSEQKWDLLLKSKADIENLLAEKTKGIMFRCKTRWIENEGRSTKYFLNLEKRRYNARVCNKIVKDDGQEVTDFVNIMAEQKNFYEDLYKKDEAVEFSLINQTRLKVNESLKAEQELPFTQKELGQALKQMKNGKTPGEDGLTAEFFKVFWSRLTEPFEQMVHEAYENNLLPQYLRRGIINLIPKSGRDSRKIKELRPITLLCVGYKIIEKAISNRLMQSYERLISEDQKGFLPGANIATNIRRVFDIMQYCEKKRFRCNGSFS